MKLSDLSLVQLQAIERIVESGLVATSESKGETGPNGEKIMELNEAMTKITESETKITTLEAAKVDLEAKLAESTAKIKELEEKATPLTEELSGLKTEVEDLRKYKATSEAAIERTNKLKAIKTKIAEAKLEVDVDSEENYWLSLSEESLTITISKLASKPTKEASASVVKVPPTNVTGDPSVKETVRAFLKEKKAKKN